jgi:predicted nicotinamide N-methyase
MSTARECVLLRAGGKLDELADAVLRGNASIDTLRSLLACLRLDRDAAAHIARAHAALARACSGGDEESEVAAECVAAACASLLPLKQTFPLCAAPGRAESPLPLRFDFSAAAGLAARDADLLAPLSALEAEAKASVAAASRVADVWVRAVPSSLRRQESQADVGALLWPAAPPLCRWLVAHGRHLRLWGSRAESMPPRVLEIGSGMGLCGLVAARLLGCAAAEPTVLTDAVDHVLDNLSFNVDLNADVGSARAARLDWSADCRLHPFSGIGAETASGRGGYEQHEPEQHEPGETERFDLIIASDHICSDADAVGVASVLRRFLRRNGLAVFLLAPPSVRWGVDKLAGAFSNAGLEERVRVIDHSFLSSSDTLATQSGGYEEQLLLHVIRLRPGPLN